MIWSSPVRRAVVDLSPIPNEIYLEIFGYLRPTDPNEWIDAEARQHFCNLALVCRFFSSVMLPWIFENLTFVEKDSYSQINSPLSSTVSAKFCCKVLDGDTTALLLAKHVKRWAFLGTPTQSKWTPAFLSMYFETFQHLPNLLELSLTNIVIPKDFFKRLADVSTLEALKLENSSFHEEVREKHLKHFKLLPLKRFALVRPRRSKIQLMRLVPHLNMSSLIRLELDFLGLEELPFSNHSLPLEYLYLRNVEDPVGFAEFLENTPYLKVLRVPWPDTFFNVVLKPQAIPQLSELEGGWSFCSQILPGRPILRLELSTILSKVGRDQGKLLANSTKSLLELRIPIFSHIDVQFWEQFSNLEKLEIRSMCSDAKVWGETAKSIFKGWNPHPNLRSLRLVFSNMSMPEIDSDAKQLLELLNVVIPAVTSIEFSFRSTVPTIQPPHPNPPSFYFDTWSYTRVVGGSWHRTFRTTRQNVYIIVDI